jgi:NAD(P)-dependent dehydrogenase (short-subunit alcohol dehydrogenase family)
MVENHSLQQAQQHHTRRRPVILITGASSGMGFATARRLARMGCIVYGAARHVERMDPLRADGVHPLFLDLTDEQSMRKAIATVLQEQGRVDALVNNAGYGQLGALEDVPLSAARRQFDVNVFGMIRLTQLVLPSMRAHRFGRIVNVSSMVGRLSLYMGGWYNATKHAVEALSDSLRMEVAPFGIAVSIIEPGAVRSRWAQIATDHLLSSADPHNGGTGAYRHQVRRAARNLLRAENPHLASDPDVVAKAITDAILSPTPRTRYRVGFGAKPVIAAHALLPDRVFDWFMTCLG